MKLETKRLLLFGVLITMTTSLYVTFLGTWLTYGIRPGFLSQWLRGVPRAYLVVLPYILLMGPLVQRLVHRLLPAPPAPQADAPIQRQLGNEAGA